MDKDLEEVFAGGSIEENDDSVIDAILEEAKFYSENKKAERRAKMFVGENAPEIFSTTKKEIRTTNTNPLDLTGELPSVALKEEPEQDEDSKTEVTMHAERLIEAHDEYEKQDEDFLNPENAPSSEDGGKEKSRYTELFGIINSTKQQSEKQHSEVISYLPEDNAMQISLKSGDFYNSIRESYEEFAHASELENNEERAAQEEENKSRRTVQEVKKIHSSFVSKLMSFFSTGEEDEIDRDGESVTIEDAEEQIADYNEKDDRKSIFEELNFRIRSTSLKSLALLALALISGALVLLCTYIPDKIGAVLTNAPIVYAIINLIITLTATVVSLSTVTNGLVPLVRFKGNSDTAAAAACVICTLQAVCALFASDEYFNGVYSYYTVIMLIALLSNALGKKVMVKRIKENFKFITSRRPNFAVELYEDEKLSREMSGGTAASDPIIAYQSKREFLTDFLKLSYAQDKSELVCARLAPATLVCTLIVGILYGILKNTFFGGMAVCALLSVICVPMCALLVSNLPMRSFCKELLRKKAMLSGYPAVVKFSQTNAVIVDASELYANGVSVCGMQTFENLRGDDAFIAAAAVLKEAKSPINSAFAGFLSKQSNLSLPKVESWIYEENLGLVAWVNNERVIIGSRAIMTKYGIKLPPIGYEEREKSRNNREVVFIAFSGVLTAMLLLKYTPQKAILTEIQRAEMNAVSILVSTTDCNITQEKIAKDFDIYYRSVKILSPGHTAVVREKVTENRPRSKAYLATKGNAASMLRMLSGCLRLRSAINVGIVLQVISVILGILLIATLCMFSSVSFITSGKVMIYTVFWFIAILIAQKIHRP